MKLLCNSCFNYTFFEADVQYLREIEVKDGCLYVKDAHYEEWNYTDTQFRNSLEDLVNYVIKSDTETLSWDSSLRRYVNQYIVCARCESREITIPYCRYNHTKHLSLEDEVKANQEDFKQFRREKHGTTLPQLWKPE